MQSEEDFFGQPLVVDSDMETWDENPNFDAIFENTINTQGNFGQTQFFEDSFGTSPAPGTPGLVFSSPAKPLPLQKPSAALSQQPTALKPRSVASSASPASSSQDSSSDSSRTRKRKTSSASSPSAMADFAMEPSEWKDRNNMLSSQSPMNFQDSYTAGTVNPSALEGDLDNLGRTMETNFAFSTASSPGYYNGGVANHTISPSRLDHKNILHTAMPQKRSSTSNKASFIVGDSREVSPVSNPMIASSEASPSGNYNAPSPLNFDGVVEGNMTGWGGSPQTLHWQPDYSTAMAAMTTPSPRSNTTASPYMPHRPVLGGPQLPKLYVGPVTTKSRVETQIAVKLTLEPLPHSVTKLHLPRHTISKAKLLAKTVVKAPDTLELTTMLVCASAMLKPGLKQRAFRRAAGLEDVALQGARRSSTGATSDADDENDPSKPANGGEVRICANCISRERKRSSRRKIKKQEDEQLWNDHENDRVIVFNEKEYQEWHHPVFPEDGQPPERMPFMEGAMQIEVPMRIACYCRHQGEKLGFQVIFTIKDFQGRLVAQAITEPILITDDHKTQGGPGPIPGMPVFDGSQNAGGTMLPPEAELPGFQHRPYHSTNDLQSLRRNFPPTSFGSKTPSQTSAMPSGTTSATMTPRNMSRQASPSAQVGPNKKRKPSSSVHKLPASLTMTRTEPTPPSGMTINPAGPLSAGLVGPGPFDLFPERPITNINPVSPTQFSAGQQPSINNSGMITPGHRNPSAENLAYNWSSVPNSTRPSRSNTPFSDTRRQYPDLMFQQQVGDGSIFPSSLSNTSSMEIGPPPPQQPTISKIIPAEGPKSGGIEVTVLGRGFERHMDVMFGEHRATAVACWGESTIVCVLPPSAKAGLVPVTVISDQRMGYSPQQFAPTVNFKYIDDQPQQLYELALRTIFEKQNGSPEGFKSWAFNLASEQRRPWDMGGSNGSYSGGSQRQASGATDMEEILLKCLDVIDMDDSPHIADFNKRTKSGATMLSLACAMGYNRIVAGLLARGSDPDARDKGGFTPLMFASMSGHAGIVRRLILRGADPMIRSLRGYVAEELAASEEVLEALRRLPHHQRSRSGGAVSMRSRASSMASVRSMYEMSSRIHISAPTSVSGEYEDESEDSEELVAANVPVPQSNWIQSRRNSLAPGVADVQGQPDHPSFPAAMQAWGNHIAAQIQQFQQTVNRSLPNFQLPALPPIPNLPDYQAHPMVRRISSLVPHRTPSRTASSSSGDLTVTGVDYQWKDLFSTPEPPSYAEACPDADNVDRDKALKESSTLLAVGDTILDRKCAELFDTVQTESSASKLGTIAESESSVEVKIGKKSITKEQQEQLRMAHARKLKKIQSDRNLFFIWLPLLFILMLVMGKNHIQAAFQFLSSMRTAGLPSNTAEPCLIELA